MQGNLFNTLGNNPAMLGYQQNFQQPVTQPVSQQQGSSSVLPFLTGAGAVYGTGKLLKNDTVKLYSGLLKDGIKQHTTGSTLLEIGKDASSKIGNAATQGTNTATSLLGRISRAITGSFSRIKNAFNAGTAFGGKSAGIKGAASTTGSILKEGLGKAAGWFSKLPGWGKAVGIAAVGVLAIAGLSGGNKSNQTQQVPPQQQNIY